MSEVVGIGVDLDDVVQRAAALPARRLCALPAVYLRLPVAPVAARRDQGLDLPGPFAGGALALAWADACALVRPCISDTFKLWRRAAEEDLADGGADVLRRHMRVLVGELGAGHTARIAVAIFDPAEEEAQERWLRLLAGLGRVDLVWRPVLAVLGLVSRPEIALPEPFSVVVVEVGWGVLRANVLRVERDPQTGLHVPERRGPGVEVRWDAVEPPPEQRVALKWIRDRDGCLVRAATSAPLTLPGVSEAVHSVAVAIGAKLAPHPSLAAAGPVIWLIEGALAGAPCAQGRLADAVVSALRSQLSEPTIIETATAETGLVAWGGAECARRLALGLPAWWDALPQLEINRRNSKGSVEFVRLVNAPRIAGGSTYKDEVAGFEVPEGATSMRFLLLHEHHATARGLDQPLDEAVPERIPVKLVVSQRPASGRARVDVVPVEPTPHFRPVRLDWDRLSDTGWDRETALRKLQEARSLRFPPKTPVPAGLHHWRRTQLPMVLCRFLSTADTSAPDYDAAARNCLHALRATRPPGKQQRVGAVSSDGEPHPNLSPDERQLLKAFRLKLDRDIRALPYDSATRRHLVLAGAWLYADAPPAVCEHLRLALKERQYGPGIVQAAGRSLSDELNVRLFFARCAEVFRQKAGHTDWAKALGQILLYREDACLWLDAERACLCLYGAVRELERAFGERGGPYPQIFNNAILALLGLLRVRRHIPGFLFGDASDPVPAEVGRRIRERLRELAGYLDSEDRRRAAAIREVCRYLEGHGTDQLVAAQFDD